MLPSADPASPERALQEAPGRSQHQPALSAFTRICNALWTGVCALMSSRAQPSEARSREGGCQLICIPPDHVGRIWPSVSGLIRAAMQRGDLSSFAAVEARVLSGNALLWLAITHHTRVEGRPSSRPMDGLERPGDKGTGPQVSAAAVTELHQTEWRKVCVIVACGGSNMSRWLDLIGPIEEFARAEKCSAMRIMGRKGWARVLPTYRPKRVVLEKKL
jgi:hypothetical protein